MTCWSTLNPSQKTLIRKNNDKILSTYLDKVDQIEFLFAQLTHLNIHLETYFKKLKHYTNDLKEISKTICDTESSLK